MIKEHLATGYFEDKPDLAYSIYDVDGDIKLWFKIGVAVFEIKFEDIGTIKDLLDLAAEEIKETPGNVA